MPSVTLHHSTTTIESSPRTLFSPIAIGPGGSTVLAGDPASASQLTVVDSTGHVAAQFAHHGAGPGEVTSALPVDVSDSAITVFDMSQLRTSRYALDGHFLNSTTSSHPIVPRVAISPTEAIGVDFTPIGWRPVLLSTTSAGMRSLLAPDDSFSNGAFPRPASGNIGEAKVPAVGTWSGGFVVGDGMTYTLALYNWNGALQRVMHRDIPNPKYTDARVDRELAGLKGARARHPSPADSARQRDALMATPLEHFPHTTSLGFDSHGRIWVAGIAGDSAYADVFSDTAFLGRIPLPCSGFEGAWSLSGEWLALVCTPDDSAFPGDAVLKVFRIVE
jgi:hypothetical protein